MVSLMSTRGPKTVCVACDSILKEYNRLDEKDRTLSEAVLDEFCLKGYDLNKVLVDDFTGSFK